MNNSERRQFTPEQKAEIVRRHLSGKEAVSALADEFDLQPSQIHTWMNLVLSQAERAFEKAQQNGRARTDKVKDRRIEQLEAKITDKNEVIAELFRIFYQRALCQREDHDDDEEFRRRLRHWKVRNLSFSMMIMCQAKCECLHSCGFRSA